MEPVFKTFMPKKLRSRNFQVTLNEIDLYPQLKENLTHLPNINYYISAMEYAPTTGHPHIHIYLQFTKPVIIPFKKLLGSHLEKCRGTPAQNVLYVKKDGRVMDEVGELRTNEETRFPTIASVKEMTKEEREELPIQYYNIIQKINDIESNIMSVDSFYKPEIKVYYIWGPSGIGKTKLVMKMIKERNIDFFDEVKHVGDFWQGISGETTTALYDDFRDSHMKASEFINFIDYNVHNLNTKFGFKKNNYDLIFITSVQNPDNLYKNLQNSDPEPSAQWRRRLSVIHLDKLEDYDNTEPK